MAFWIAHAVFALPIGLIRRFGVDLRTRMGTGALKMRINIIDIND